MKASEFRKLIREEVRRVLKEAGDPSKGYAAIEYAVDSESGKSAAKYAKQKGISNSDIVASFQSGEWKAGSFDPIQLADFVTNLKMSQAEIDSVASALKYSPKQAEKLKSNTSNLSGQMGKLLDQFISGTYEQFDEFKVQSSLVSVVISPQKNTASKIYDALEKNKSKLASFLQANELPNCKLFFAIETAGFGGDPKVIITSKPKPSSAKVQKVSQI
jgi:hypothetical protein